MPKIVIKGKGLVKAQYQNSQVGEKQVLSCPDGQCPDASGKCAPCMSQSISQYGQFSFPTQSKPVVANTPEQQEASKKANEFAALQGIVKGKDFINTQDAKGNFYSTDPNAKKFKPTAAPLPVKEKQTLLNKAAKITDPLIAAASFASPLIDSIVGRKNQISQDIDMGLSDNSSVIEQRDRGFWDPNTGASQPNNQTPVNWGMMSGQFLGSSPYRVAKNGGQTTMKIKITAVPGEQMAYGGQAKHSLDLRRDALANPNISRKDNYEVNSGPLKPVPRSQANIEAEEGEYAYGDLNGDGKIENEEIGGKRHHDGGTPLNLPNGVFIFSDTAKMRIRDPQVLSYFSLKPKAGGYTPAEIAKKYDIKKYRAILENPLTDQLNKDTAQLMLTNYNRKLGYLALTQESMKGFPQGIPEVAKQVMTEEELAQYGGIVSSNQEGEEEQNDMLTMAKYGGEELQKYQGLQGPSQVTGAAQPSQLSLQELQKKYPWFKPFIKAKTTAGGRSRTTGVSTLFDPSVQNQYSDLEYWVKDAESKGISIKSTGDLQRYVYQEMEKEDPSKIQEMWKTFGPTNVSDKQDIDNFADTIAGGRSLFLLSKKRPVTPVQEVKEEKKEEEKKNPETYYGPGVIGQTLPPKKFQKGWYTPDKWNFLAAALVPPKKYDADVYDPYYMPGKYGLKDWRARVAARQSAFNKLSDTMGVYGPTQGLASNLSFAAGQTAEGASSDIADVADKNVDIFNQAMAQEAARKDAYNQLLAQNKGLRKTLRTDADKDYRNDLRSYYNNLATAGTKGWGNMMYGNLLDAANQRYNVNRRTGSVDFMGGRPSSQLPSYNTGALDWNNLLSEYNKAKGNTDLSFETFLKYQRPSSSQSDFDERNLEAYKKLFG